MKNRNSQLIRHEVYAKYNGHCAYCGCEISSDNFHIDHIVPIRRGTRDDQLRKSIRGTNEINNYNPSCVSCNSSKNEIDIELWRNELSLKVMRLNRDSSQYRLMKRFGLIKETGIGVIFYYEKHQSNG